MQTKFVLKIVTHNIFTNGKRMHYSKKVIMYIKYVYKYVYNKNT